MSLKDDELIFSKLTLSGSIGEEGIAMGGEIKFKAPSK